VKGSVCTAENIQLNPTIRLRNNGLSFTLKIYLRKENIRTSLIEPIEGTETE